MARNTRTSLTTSNVVTLPVIPQTAIDEAGKHVPSQTLSALPFWKDLKAKEQETLRHETQQTLAAILMEASSRLAIGQHLQNIQTTLIPYNGAFTMYLKTLRKFNPNLSERKAYRYMEGYRNAQARLPNAVLKAAMIRGMDILGYTEEKPLGRYTEAVQALPPPINPDPETADKYLSQLEDKRREIRTTPATAGTGPDIFAQVQADEQFLLQQSFRMVKNALKKLPQERKKVFCDTLFGMVLTEAGIQASVRIAPHAIPAEFSRGRGRVRETGQEAEVA